MSSERLRAWCWTRQGLDGSCHGDSVAAILGKAGWMRSIGGGGPYIGLFARAGLQRAQVDAAVARLAIHELPSARGCTYVLPAEHFALGLRLGQGFGEAAQIATARKYLGFTEAEQEGLCTEVLAALAEGPLDPRGLKERLGEAVRNLGTEGKKRGQTTTLPLALGWLHSRGDIRRIPLDGRLDRQRYAYVRWCPNPLAPFPRSDAEIRAELARLYFHWAGPASLAQFQAFSGLGVKDSKAAVADLDLVADGEQLWLPEDKRAFDHFEVPASPQVQCLAGTDGLFLHRRDAAACLDGADATRAFWTETGSQAGGALVDLPHQAIVDRGRIIGLWDYDGEAGELVWTTFAPPSEATQARVTEVERFIRDDLGDFRTFSLDSPESRRPRIAALRAMRS